MTAFLALLRRLILNPKISATVIVLASSIIQKKFTTMDITPETAEPLFLPRGTIRALFALVLLAATIADYMMPNWELPDEYHLMTIAIVAYYIGYRSDNARIKEIKI